MEKMVTANIALDIFSIILSLIPVVFLTSNYRYRQKLNQYFLGICIANVIMVAGDLADWMISGTLDQSQQLLLTVSTVIFYAASALVLYFFARYMDEYLKLSGRIRKIYLTSITFVCSVQVLFALISPFTSSFFYINESGYHRGKLFLISQFVPFFCYLIFTIMVIAYRKRLSAREVVFFLLYIFVPLFGGALQMFLRGIAVVNIGVALALLFIMVNIQFERELIIKRQEQELSDMRIDIMLSQIQPHFLYNTLTTIRQLCDIDPEMAKESIRDFAYFLRGNMDSLTNKAPIPFEQELRHAEHYLKLEQQRFVDRLHIEMDTPVLDFSIPPLTLQPLVENAVRHGIMMREEGGTLTIHTEETSEFYIVTVSDDGVGFDPKSVPAGADHIGIRNVRERLNNICGGVLQITSILNQGTNAVIMLPKEGNL